MIIKVITDIYVKVADVEEAEAAASLFSHGLANVLDRDFPHGEVITVDVNHFVEATEEEVREYSLDEE